MNNLISYKKMPLWTAETLPEPFKKMHNTKVGTWAQLNILKGEITFEFLNEDGSVSDTVLLNATTPIPLVEPQQWHRIAKASDDIECYLEFFCKKEDYFSKKYGYTKTHSEVLAAQPLIPKGRVLDLGSGEGRNSLYLASLGYDVTSLDWNVPSLQKLQEVAAQEGLSLEVEPYDIECADIPGGQYDWIVSTVVLMFLHEEVIPDVIENMQSHTASGGYNLIVAAMSTEDAPCPVNFPFTFKEDELLNYYAGWEILKYNEDFGELHKTDENGNRLRFRFATLLAKKG
ncbi:SAM-dependent methyltransferase TehB [uncultured Granulicatella sp.]|uniref:SAM-dependent methyltransferase TehB n=1 Tax=uncultured Granulicatella sp. TaxID=316089 RepID=UPI0028DB57CE|nr:SAM-dependent methyltransferase TehB [uncultured Granulicatella sp.]